MAILPVVLHPDTVLRQKCTPVTDITPEILQLLEDMLETMYAEEGIGLAAPQVNVTKRVIVLDTEQEDGKPGNPLKLINPEIIAKSETTTILSEGCLSLPKMQAEIARPEEVTVRYMDIEGKTQEIHATDLLSKALRTVVNNRFKSGGFDI